MGGVASLFSVFFGLCGEFEVVDSDVGDLPVLGYAGDVGVFAESGVEGVFDAGDVVEAFVEVSGGGDFFEGGGEFAVFDEFGAFEGCGEVSGDGIGKNVDALNE